MRISLNYIFILPLPRCKIGGSYGNSVNENCSRYLKWHYAFSGLRFLHIFPGVWHEGIAIFKKIMLILGIWYMENKWDNFFSRKWSFLLSLHWYLIFSTHTRYLPHKTPTIATRSPGTVMKFQFLPEEMYWIAQFP